MEEPGAGRGDLKGQGGRLEGRRTGGQAPAGSCPSLTSPRGAGIAAGASPRVTATDGPQLLRARAEWAGVAEWIRAAESGPGGDGPPPLLVSTQAVLELGSRAVHLCLIPLAACPPASKLARATSEGPPHSLEATSFHKMRKLRQEAPCRGHRTKRPGNTCALEGCPPRGSTSGPVERPSDAITPDQQLPAGPPASSPTPLTSGDWGLSRRPLPWPGRSVSADKAWNVVPCSAECVTRQGWAA